MKTDPKEMLICSLECLLMPNGEIISQGQSLGWFDKLGINLTALRRADGTKVEEGKYL